MGEVALAEPQALPESQTPPPSAAGINPPSDDVAPPVSLEEQGAGAGEEGTPAQDAGEKETAKAAPEARHNNQEAQTYYKDLGSKVNEAGWVSLSDEEKAWAKRYEQSLGDYQATQRQATEAVRKAQKEVSDFYQALPASVIADLSSAFGIDPDLDPTAKELAQRKLGDKVAEALEKAEPMILGHYHAGMRAAMHDILISSGVSGNEATGYVASLEGRTFPEVLEAYGNLRFRQGQGTNPDASKLTKAETELTKVRLDLEKANASLKGNGSGASTTGKGASGGPNLTLSQIDAMPTHEWMAMGDAETRQRILAAAHARERQ